MKQTSSHTSSFKGGRKERDHLEILDRSEEPSKVEPIEKIQEEDDEAYLPYEIENELDMNIEKYSEEVKDELRYLLIDLLKYPSTKQAVRHRSSNRMGSNDLKNIKNKLTGQSNYTSGSFYEDRCQDCELLVQQREIETCASLWEFPKVGLGSYNLYRNMKIVMAMIFILGLIYSVINLIVNIRIVIEAATVLTGQTYLVVLLNTIQILNFSSNTLLVTVIGLSVFLLIITVLVWWLAIFVIMCISQKYEREVDQAFLSASDFTIMLQNVPIHLSEDKLKLQFERYFESLVFNHNIKNTWGEVLKPFTIKKICRTVPFSLSESQVFDKELQGLDRDIVQKKRQFAEWVFEMKYNSRFTYTKSEREREYINFERMFDRRKNKIMEMEIRAREQYQRANDRIKTTVLVTFDYNQSASIIEYLNPQTIPAKIRYLVSACKSTQYFDIRDNLINEESDIIASRAPEPEDIIWGNVAVPLSVLVIKKLLVWLVMIVLSGTLLGIIFGISFAQANGTGTWSSIFIGFLVSFFNLITKFTLRKLSEYEKDFTYTQRQRGILLKGLFVLGFNWTIPIIVTNVAKESNNIFGLNGLANEVFYICIFESFLPPLVRIFDPEHLFLEIRGWWKNQPYNKIILKQSQLNDLLEQEDYELGWCHIYFLNILFFSCFYVTIFPGVVIFTLFGSLLMFWVEKYCLLNRSRRPEKIARTLTNSVETLFSMAPFVLWVGHLLWVNAQIPDFSSVIFTGNMILMGLSLLYFVTPWHGLFNCLFRTPEEETLSYDECRSKFPVQYDRLNPASIREGFRDYKDFLMGKRRGREDDEADSKINISEQNLVEPFDTRYVLQQISKIPSIFGRRNDVSRKIDREADIKPRNLRGEDMELMMMPKEDSHIQHSNVKVRVHSKGDSYQQVGAKKGESEEVRARPKQESFDTVDDGDRNRKLNVSSSGNAYGKKKLINDKRKTISVIDKPENYDYERSAPK